MNFRYRWKLWKREWKRFAYARTPRLVRLFLHFFRKPRPSSIEAELAKISSPKQGFCFIQVGANDGLINDPLIHLIRRDRWKGLLLEPQPVVFEKELKPLHARFPELVTLNLAISTKIETRDLYTLSFSQKRWATGLSSFIKESLEEKIQSGYVEACAKKFGDKLPSNQEDYIQAIKVECVPFEILLNQYEIKHLDLLQIDTEGFDFEIIKMFPFEICSPKSICFETESLSPSELESCRHFLEEKGYSLKFIGRDCLAIMKNEAL